MEDYGRTFKGKMYIEALPVLPTHKGADDEGRLIYTEDTKQVFYGTAGTWSPWGSGSGSGSSGTSGVSGTSGTSGSAGSHGTSGIDGSHGTSGIDGSHGTSGIAGSHGTSGTNGTHGTSGTNGSHGTSGTNGSHGTSGTNGSHGTSGVDGSHGTSGTTGIVGGYLHAQGTAWTAWTAAHNLNYKFPVISVWVDDELSDPYSITPIDANNLLISFGTSSVAGTAAISVGGGSSGTSGTGPGTNGTFNSLKITGDYMEGTSGTSGKVVNIYYGTAATMGTTGVPDGAVYYQYT